MATKQQSHACCTVPPVQGDNYKEKGEYITVQGLKTYATGPKNAKKALLVIFDIFGFFPQTLQGADILSTGDHENQYRVFIPDFFDGKPVSINDFPPDNDEKKAKLGKFFEGHGAPPLGAERVPKIVDELQKEGNFEAWGVVGFCWGGKVVNLTSQEGTKFKSAAAAHPAMVDAGDAAKITIPVALLPSKDESKEDVEKWEKAVKGKKLVEWFPDQVHGWMAARADLSDKRVVEEYQRGYKLLLDWFHETL